MTARRAPRTSEQRISQALRGLGGTLGGQVVNASPVSRVNASRAPAARLAPAAPPQAQVRFYRDRFPAGTGGLTAAQSTFVLDYVPEPDSQHVTRIRSGVSLNFDEGVDYTLTNATISLTTAAAVGDVIDVRYASYAALAAVSEPQLLGLNGDAFSNGNMSISLAATSAQLGDRIFIAWINSDALVTQVTGGFTEIVSESRTNSGNGLRVQVFTKIATATEPGSYTFNGPANDNHAAVIFLLRGVEATVGLAVHDGAAFARSATITFPELAAPFRHKVMWIAGVRRPNTGVTVASPGRGSLRRQEAIADTLLAVVEGAAGPSSTEAVNTLTASDADTFATGMTIAVRY